MAEVQQEATLPAFGFNNHKVRHLYPDNPTTYALCGAGTVRTIDSWRRRGYDEYAAMLSAGDYTACEECKQRYADAAAVTRE